MSFQHQRFTSFTQLDPEVAKLDMSLVRGIDTHAQKQSIVRAMKTLCDELRITVVAEGVETAAERDTAGTARMRSLSGVSVRATRTRILIA